MNTTDNERIHLEKQPKKIHIQSSEVFKLYFVDSGSLNTKSQNFVDKY